MQRHATRRARVLQSVMLLVAGAQLLRNIAPAFIPVGRTPSLGARVAGSRGATALRAEDEGGGMSKFLKVEEETITLTEEEYEMALDQEKESQRGKYYIGGKVGKKNLVVPWKDVNEEDIDKDARAQLKKNGIKDPKGEAAEMDEGDTGIAISPIGEQDVKIQWKAGEPGNRVGYILERKKAMDTNFEEIATYEDQDSPYLLAMPYAGHEYEFEDKQIKSGAYTYRVLVRDRGNKISVVDQKEITIEEAGGVENLYAFALLGFLFAFTLFYGSFVDPELS